MRGHSLGVESVDILTRVLRAEFPELDAERLKAAVERAVARVASAALDTEGYQVVNLHLQKAEATEESEERSNILRELSETLEQRGDADRALVVRLSAFAEVASQADLGPLLRLARITERWSELPLESMSALVDINHEDAAIHLAGLATAWQQVGRPYYAADCFERVLLIHATDHHAFEQLEVFYRANAEWSVLVDLLGRRAIQTNNDKERAELYREMAFIYDKELKDESAALDAYREADRLEPGRQAVLEGLARLSLEAGQEEEALDAAERFGSSVQEPKERSKALCKAADLARLQNWDKAQKLYEEARKADPELKEAVDGLASLLRDKGELSAAIQLLVNAAETSDSDEKSRWLVDAADFCVALGDTDWAKQLYKDARAADPLNQKAGVALVEICWDSGDLVELAPILDLLCRTTDDPQRLRQYLIQRSKVAALVGDQTGARNALARAVEIDPEDVQARRELADMLWDAQQWLKARQLMEGLLVDEDLLPPGVAVELHYKVARSAKELGDKAAAAKHVDIALALSPDHRAARLMRTELGGADPMTNIEDQLALANTAPPDEKATRFAAIGDRYVELGDRTAAREMYREALSHRPGDHVVLTKFLELVTEEGDWSYSMDVVQRLIDSEKDPKVRARYRHLAGMIARDEIDDHARATELFSQAVDDDPFNFAAADELEALLDASDDRKALAAYFYKRLEQVRNNEGRDGERLRLWDHLGELLLELDNHDDAIVAFEVALSLDTDNISRRKRLADLYTSDTKHDAKAIAQHHAILRDNKRQLDSYKALRSLYERIRQPERARACQEALDVISEIKKPSDPAPRDVPLRTLANEDWLVLTKLDVDLQLSALFAVVAPPFAVERARMRPPVAVQTKEHELPAWVQKVFTRVLTALGTPRPPVYFEREVASACKLQMRLRDGVLVPVLVFGKPVIERQADDHELAFHLSRQLADLRTERIARLLCPRAGELAQIIEMATAPEGDAGSHAARWLSTSLHPVELEQTRMIGGRLRERGVQPMASAVSWLAATERAADRIGLVVTGDLPRCVKIIEREPGAADSSRVLDLAWSSTTEDVLNVRARIEGWVAVPPPIPPRTTQVRSAQ
jgi:tetratricopeptide (TPR) repeat protein